MTGKYSTNEEKKYRKAMAHILVCQRPSCGRPANEVHHIIYRSEVPKHPNLHNPLNLLKVCRKCHVWYHAKKDRRDKLVLVRGLRELFPERFGLKNDKKIFY